MVKQKKKTTVIGVPFGMGAGVDGAQFGAARIMAEGGLLARLERLGLDYEAAILSETERKLAASDSSDNGESERLKHLAEVLDMNERLADAVHQAVNSGSLPLVLGGDHSIAMGTLAGMAQHHNNIGVIWLDAHSDMNTADSSPSGNIHGMSLAASLGMGDSRLTALKGITPKLRPEHVAIIGARSLDDGEKEFIRSLGIACYTMHDIDRLGIAVIMERVLKQMQDAGCRVHVSFDIDVVDPREAPGTGTPVRGGLSYREAHFVMELLYQSGLVASAELVEVNPLLDIDDKTAKLAAELIGSLLGEQIL